MKSIFFILAFFFFALLSLAEVTELLEHEAEDMRNLGHKKHPEVSDVLFFDIVALLHPRVLVEPSLLFNKQFYVLGSFICPLNSCQHRRRTLQQALIFSSFSFPSSLAISELLAKALKQHHHLLCTIQKCEDSSSVKNSIMERRHKWKALHVCLRSKWSNGAHDWLIFVKALMITIVCDVFAQLSKSGWSH